MQATYCTTLSYYSRNAEGALVKTVLVTRQGFNARAQHTQAQKDLNALLDISVDVSSVEVYTCLQSGEVKGYGQPFERNSLRYRENARWTHTDF